MHGAVTALVALQGAWDTVVMSLSRQHAATADAIDGLVELRLVLGDRVQGINSLYLARPRSQNGLTKAIWRYAERSFCATADDQLAAGKGPGSVWRPRSGWSRAAARRRAG